MQEVVFLLCNSFMMFDMKILVFMAFESIFSYCTPIYYAVKYNKIDCVKALLKNEDIDLDCENAIFFNINFNDGVLFIFLFVCLMRYLLMLHPQIF